MGDRYSIAERSAIMARVRAANTRPEITVRRLLHRLNYRFRLHRRDLPGTPDLVLPKYRAVVFVHGCFWHRHTCPRGQVLPVSNRDYWQPKLARNVERDARAREALHQLGWRALTIWECEVADSALADRIHRFLRGDGAHSAS